MQNGHIKECMEKPRTYIIHHLN